MNTAEPARTAKAVGTVRVRLVIPAYRESGRLPVFGAALVERLEEFAGAVELLLVDDGSGPEEAGKLAAMTRSWRERRPWVRPLLVLEKNSGKGAAVYAGWDEAASATPQAAWLGFCDADGSVDADETARLIRMLETMPADVGALISSRRAKGASCQGRRASRLIASRAFSAWVRIWTKLKVRDSQCGCKFIRTGHYRRARPELRLRRFAFDVELLTSVSEHGGRIIEEGVAWKHRAGGALRVWRDGLTMLVAVASLGFGRSRRP